MCVRGTCTLGREWPRNTANPNAGTYIDISNPAACSGQIAEFQLCFYNPRNFHPGADVLPITLQVWRFDDEFVNGILEAERMEDIIIPQTPENFQCIPVPLNQPIQITQGDLLGVQLLENMVLPVIGNVDQVFGPRILFIEPSESPTTINRLTLPVDALFNGNGIHITAEIVPLEVTTTSPVTEGETSYIM